uniref:Association with the SNF1 complex (ASC) domain-containing protein n=1 Tax=Chrysotila carterae TaxID=13221 RepID=A0A7S4C4J6_CHRCT|mmetsp:Transcript_30757/g.67355  ORF Transcript_30757/g.67355 Transcript_30757/m.67355 type:complete len:336 (+) Transcript_30757:463-1470(+)
MGQSGSRDEGFAAENAAYPQQASSSGVRPEQQQRESAVVPTVLQWSQGGHAVYVTGSFNAWGERIPMRRSGQDCVVCLNLLPGTYQYKFIVDNEWRFAADQPTVRDEMGNINNCVTVEDQTLFMREEPMSGFFNDNAPNLYTQALPDVITLAKEPPQAPPHLWCLPLNVAAAREANISALSLEPPLSVTLTHVSVLSSSPTLTLGVTRRFRHKYVTIIIYKPRERAREVGSGARSRGDASGSAEVGGFRVPALPVRDGWVRAGGKQPAAAVPAGAGAPGGSGVMAAPMGAAIGTAGGVPSFVGERCDSSDEAADLHRPMEISSRPASQAAFMELG